MNLSLTHLFKKDSLKKDEQKIYIYDTLINSLCIDKTLLVDKTNLISSQVGALWKKIEESYSDRPYFNFSYLERLCRKYYSESTEKKTFSQPSIYLSTILSHVYFKNRRESVNERCFLISNVLRGLKLPEFKIERVNELIKCANSPLDTVEWTQREYMDLKFYSLFCDYGIFKLRQGLLIQDRPPFLTKSEFILCLKSYYLQLIKKHNDLGLFNTIPYRQQHEKLVFDNLTAYVAELDNLQTSKKIANVTEILNS